MKPAYGRLLLALSLLLLLSAPAVMAQDPPPITAQNVSQLAPLLEIPLLQVYGLNWQDDATLAVSTSAGGTYYQLDTGEATTTPFSPYRHIFSPDGRLVLELDRSGYFEPEYTFRLYDATTGEILVTRGGQHGILTLRDAAFTPDSAGIIFFASDNMRQRQIAYADVRGLVDGTTDLEDILTTDGQYLWRFQLSPFSQPDDLVFVLRGVDYSVNIWRLEDIHQLATTPPLTTTILENSYYATYLFSGPDELVTWERGREKGLVRWWDTNTGAMQREVVIEFDHRSEEIRAISPDAHYALVYRWPEAECELWDLTLDQALPGTLPDPAHVAFSPDGRRLAYLDDYGVLTWMEIATGEKHVAMEGFDRRVLSTEFNANSDLLRVEYYVMHSTTAKYIQGLWDVPAGRNVLTLYDTQSAFSPDGQTLVAGGSDGILRFYDGHSGDVIRTLADERFDAPFSAVAFHPEGRWLACSLLNGAFFLIDLEDETIHVLAPKTDDERQHSFALLFSPDGHTLAAQVERQLMIYAYLWDVTTRRPILDASPSRIFSGRMLFSPDGTQLVLGGGRLLGAGQRGCIAVYDTQTGEMLTRIGSGYLVGELPDVTTHPYGRHIHREYVDALAFDPRENFLIARSSDNLALWDISLAIEYRIGIEVADAGVDEMIYSFRWPFGMALHPTRPWLAIASHDGHAYLWDMTDPHHVQAMALESEAGTVGFSPDGQLLVGGGLNRLELWDMDTLTPIPGLPGYFAQSDTNAVQFSPDGRYLLTQVGPVYQSDRIIVWGVSP